MLMPTTVEEFDTFRDAGAMSPAPREAVRLNLGGGDIKIAGFVNVDRKLGTEVYPLPNPDNSVAEIYASHILEHFPYEDTAKVLAEWYRVLEPGARIRVSVPDMRKIAERIVKGQGGNFAGWIYGGHTDENDRHAAAFDVLGLKIMLQQAGFTSIREFEPFVDDCSRVEISANVEGYKPLAAEPVWKTRKIAALMSVPRLMFTDNVASLMNTLPARGIEVQTYQGAYWHHRISEAMKDYMDDVEWLLCIDYDTLFDGTILDRLLTLFEMNPDIDALAPVQCMRGGNQNILMWDKDKPINAEGDLVRVTSAHFGLTLIRASSLKKLPKPWMSGGTPNESGDWGDGRVDPDIEFWQNWNKAGLNVSVAHRLPVGHLELMAKWPGESWETIYGQPSQFFRDGGPPKGTRC